MWDNMKEQVVDMAGELKEQYTDPGMYMDLVKQVIPPGALKAIEAAKAAKAAYDKAAAGITMIKGSTSAPLAALKGLKVFK
jgi:hypothetical protein